MEQDEQLDLVMQIVLAYLDSNEVMPEEIAPLIDGVATSIARMKQPGSGRPQATSAN